MNSAFVSSIDDLEQSIQNVVLAQGVPCCNLNLVLDENNVMILFSEYHIGFSGFCLQHANADGVDGKFKESIDDLPVG